MLIDTHAHLWWESYKNDVDEVIERALIARVEKIIVPGTNVVSSEAAINLAKSTQASSLQQLEFIQKMNLVLM